MRVAKTTNYPIYSSGYLFSVSSEAQPVKRPGVVARLARYLLAIPGRFWRALCFKVILITILALLCGFFFGAVWGIIEMDSYEAYEEYDSKIEWLLYEAEI